MASPDGNLEVEEKEDGDVLILKLTGRLDAVSSPGTEKRVFDHINEGSHKLVMDFGGVDYLSSAGMRMLLSTTKKLKTLSGKLVVCNVTTNVMDVLKMSGFDHVLELAPNRRAAMEKF